MIDHLTKKIIYLFKYIRNKQGGSQMWIYAPVILRDHGPSQSLKYTSTENRVLSEIDNAIPRWEVNSFAWGENSSQTTIIIHCLSVCSLKSLRLSYHTRFGLWKGVIDITVNLQRHRIHIFVRIILFTTSAIFIFGFWFFMSSLLYSRFVVLHSRFCF